MFMWNADVRMTAHSFRDSDASNCAGDRSVYYGFVHMKAWETCFAPTAIEPRWVEYVNVGADGPTPVDEAFRRRPLQDRRRPAADRENFARNDERPNPGKDLLH